MIANFRSIVAIVAAACALGWVTSNQNRPSLQPAKPNLEQGIATADIMVQASLGKLMPSAVLLVELSQS